MIYLFFGTVRSAWGTILGGYPWLANLDIIAKEPKGLLRRRQHLQELEEFAAVKLPSMQQGAVDALAVGALACNDGSDSLAHVEDDGVGVETETTYGVPTLVLYSETQTRLLCCRAHLIRGFGFQNRSMAERAMARPRRRRRSRH